MANSQGYYNLQTGAALTRGVMESYDRRTAMQADLKKYEHRVKAENRRFEMADRQYEHRVKAENRQYELGKASTLAQADLWSQKYLESRSQQRNVLHQNVVTTKNKASMNPEYWPYHESAKQSLSDYDRQTQQGVSQMERTRENFYRNISEPFTPNPAYNPPVGSSPNTGAAIGQIGGTSPDAAARALPDDVTLPAQQGQPGVQPSVSVQSPPIRGVGPIRPGYTESDPNADLINNIASSDPFARLDLVPTIGDAPDAEFDWEKIAREAAAITDEEVVGEPPMWEDVEVQPPSSRMDLQGVVQGVGGKRSSKWSRLEKGEIAGVPVFIDRMSPDKLRPNLYARTLNEDGIEEQGAPVPYPAPYGGKPYPEAKEAVNSALSSDWDELMSQLRNVEGVAGKEQSPIVDSILGKWLDGVVIRVGENIDPHMTKDWTNNMPNETQKLIVEEAIKKIEGANLPGVLGYEIDMENMMRDYVLMRYSPGGTITRTSSGTEIFRGTTKQTQRAIQMVEHQAKIRGLRIARHEENWNTFLNVFGLAWWAQNRLPEDVVAKLEDPGTVDEIYNEFKGGGNRPNRLPEYMQGTFDSQKNEPYDLTDPNFEADAKSLIQRDLKELVDIISSGNAPGQKWDVVKGITSSFIGTTGQVAKGFLPVMAEKFTRLGKGIHGHVTKPTNMVFPAIGKIGELNEDYLRENPEFYADEPDDFIKSRYSTRPMYRR